MKKALYIGIFDPINLGHLDIIERASKLIDELVIGVFVNPTIPSDIAIEKRIEMVEKSVKHIENVTVARFNGDIDTFIKTYQINLYIRGLRMMTELEQELNIVHANNHLKYKLDTIFLATNELYANYSSKEVRLIAKKHGNIEPFLPKSIVNDVKRIYA